MMSIKKLVVAAAVLTATMGAGLAQANERADVQWSITIGDRGEAPVYVAPYPVYRQPAPAYRAYPQNPTYPIYQHPTRWDRDGDGIPNRYDPVYNPRWDRDGDGIPNRYDRWDNLRHERDWRERRDERSWGR
jgi:hypothetical protein